MHAHVVTQELLGTFQEVHLKDKIKVCIPS